MADNRKRNRKRKDEFFDVLRPYLGQAVTRLRGKMSQEELAGRAKMDAGTLRRLEKGITLFRQDYIVGICSGLDIEIEDLLRAAADCYEQERKKTRPYQQMESDELLQILRRAHSASARLEQQLVDIDLEIKRRQLGGTTS